MQNGDDTYNPELYRRSFAFAHNVVPGPEEHWSEERKAVADILTGMNGLISATFTLSQPASTGDHPENIAGAWVGVPLPIRLYYDRPEFDGNVRILCVDAYNALVESGADETVLQYWINKLDGRAGPSALFVFPASDGMRQEVSQ